MAHVPIFGINGFGRIGRTTFRTWWQYSRSASKLAVINTSGSMDIAGWAHLLKYDSNYGIFGEEIIFSEHQPSKTATDEDPVIGTLSIGAYEIIVTAQKDPAKIPWKKYGVEVVAECTGAFTSKEKASAHLSAGASYVVISSPAKGEGINTSVIGVKDIAQNDFVSSNASCTTNCVGPVTAIMQKEFGIKKAMLTTIHSYTDDQNTQDNSHKDLRRARTAAQNIIPTSTGAAVAVTETIPELKGLFDGLAIRVPTPVGSLSDMVFLVSKPTTIEEVNQAFIDSSKKSQWEGILATTSDPIVSSDIVGRTESSIVDLSLTNVIDGDLVKVISWYDNEWAYCCRLNEQMISVGQFV